MLFIVCVVYRRITISILYEDIESTASIISTYNQFNNSENVQNTRHSGHTSGKEPAYRQCRRLKRRGFDPWVGKIPLRRKWQPTPVFLPGESHEQRSLVGYSGWGPKESDTTDPLRAHMPPIKDLTYFSEDRIYCMPQLRSSTAK